MKVEGPKLDFVRVIWWDAQDLGKAWVAPEEVAEFADEPCPIISYGYLVKRTKAYVTLAADYACIDGDFSRVTKIPSPWVRSLSKAKF